MTDSILSLPLETVTDKQLVAIKGREGIAVVMMEKCYGTHYFFLKRPVPLIYSKVNSIMTRFVIMVHLECPYNNKLHSSSLDRCIMSNLTDFETKSRRTLHQDENLGQCRRKCSLSSIPI